MPRTRGRGVLAVVLGAALVFIASPTDATAAGPTVSLAFTPVADTFVNADAPDRSYGTGTAMYVDAAPIREAYLRFDVRGLDGRPVSRVRLRMSQRDTDGSPLGGEIRTLSDAAWGEDITWTTRPDIDGPLVGSFEAVTLGRFYEADLDPTIARNGALSLAITSFDRDASVWSSREGGHPPELIIDVAARLAPAHDGTRIVSNDFTASSDPTYFANGHRIAVTERGRLYVVHGKHANGVQARWRDVGGTWQSRSRGGDPSGVLEDEAGTGDVPAAIAIGRDPSGAEHAWTVWGGARLDGRPLELRRLSDLDNPEGPHIGPRIVVDDAERGTARPDILAADGPDGLERLWITYTRRVGAERYQVVVRTIDDLAAEAPRASRAEVIHDGPSSRRTATLVRAGARVAVLATVARGAIALFLPSGSGWRSIGTGLQADPAAGHPAVTAMTEDVLIGAFTDRENPPRVTVARISTRDGSSTIEARLDGYRDPTVASDGTRAWVVMVRVRDGAIVSRERRPDGSWTRTDVVEIAAEDGPLMWPNALRRGARVEFVASRPGGTLGRAAVVERTRTPLPLPAALENRSPGSPKHASRPPGS